MSQVVQVFCGHENAAALAHGARPVRPVVAPGAPHEEAGAIHTQWPRGHFPYNEFTIFRCAAGAHLACARGTMPRAPLRRTGLLLSLRRRRLATTATAVTTFAEMEAQLKVVQVRQGVRVWRCRAAGLCLVVVVVWLEAYRAWMVRTAPEGRLAGRIHPGQVKQVSRPTKISSARAPEGGQELPPATLRFPDAIPVWVSHPFLSPSS